MKIIVGLGNPGKEYDSTRHNLGFMALDFYLQSNHHLWHTRQKFQSVCFKQDDIIFLKPQTFYNDVGISVKKCADYHKVSYSNIYVICDDFNLEFGKIRFRQNGSAGGNNGLKSIIYHLKTPDFPRIRIGTNNESLKKQLGDTGFVLGKFTSEEFNQLSNIFLECNQKIDQIISDKL